MLKVENICVSGFEAAIRGMRNPMNSWDKSDSHFECGCDGSGTQFVVGENDLDLMRRLFKAGTEHRKFLRMITVTMDITCHHFWWAEFDTYKVGTVRNSCSKMHKIHVKPFEIDDFSHEGIDEVGNKLLSRQFENTIETLEWLRVQFNETQERKYWRAMLELLPMGYNLKATVQMSYETVFNIIRQRDHHKVFEWIQFTNILKILPYVKEIGDLQ